MPMQTSPHTTQVLQPNAQLSPGVRELFVTAWGMTDRGRVRSTNEDQFVIAALTGTLWVQQSSLPQPRVRCGEPTGHLFVVADGIGGHGGGARASALAVEVVEKLALGALGRLFMPAGGPSSFASDLGPSDELEHAVREADATVRTEASEDASLSQMGTTLTLAYSLGDQLYVAHVGDSRCYLLRDGALRQLTHDHTIAGELAEAGVVVQAAALDRYRHVLTNAVGGGVASTKVELQGSKLMAGDVVVLSSDGLHDSVEDAVIADILRREPSPERACAALIRAANEAGGRDNTTVVVARYDAPVPGRSR
ncbi:MAG: serine/threonine-protein phosphatase [Polyangiaceae bacterium]|jgi:serine/threonine protein phosphatase PrpC|nr:serine/threonine-protein phosphatase [Polyangiaceae bacterium]MBK8937339.1 serine/threonine-protein phosphatase [Polyangiaceae bacterium]